MALSVDNDIGSDIGTVQNSYAGVSVDLSSWWVASVSKKIKFSVNESTRLTNLSYNAETWGKFIPITWGTARIEGAMIWASPFREGLVVTNWKRLSSEGRPKFQTNLGYVYKVDVGYSFGYNGHPAKRRYLSRLYMNNTIVYDYAGGYRYPGMLFTFKDGGPGQLPPKIYKDDKGEDAVAFRNQLSVWVQDLPIGDFGAAIPSVWAEIVTEDVADYTRLYFNDSFPGDPDAPEVISNNFVIDWNMRKLYAPTYSGTASINRMGIIVYDIDSREKIAEYEVTGDNGSIWPWSSIQFTTYIPWLRILVTGFSGSREIGSIEADTGRVIDSTASFVGSDPFFYYLGLAVCPDYHDEGGAWFLGSSSYLSAYGLIVGRINSDGTFDRSSYMRIPNDYGGGLASVSAVFGDDTLSRLYYIWYDDSHDFWCGMIDCEVLENTSEWIHLGAAETLAPFSGLQFNGLIVIFTRTLAGTPTTITAYDSQTKEVIYTLTGENWSIPSHEAISRGNFASGVISWATVNGNIATLDIMSGTLATVNAGGSFSIGIGLWDCDSGSFFYYDSLFEDQFYQQYCIMPPAQTMRLDVWLKDMLEMAGFTSTQYSITGINDLIEGAFINKAVDPIATIRDVCQLYRISFTESNGKIALTKKVPDEGAVTPEISVDYSRLAWLNESGDSKSAISMTLSSEINTPSEVTVAFINPDMNYGDDSYTYKRPGVTTTSAVSMSLSVPLMISKGNVAILTQNMLYDVWGGQLTGSIRLPRPYYNIDEGTIINLMHSGFSDVVRLTEVTHNGDWSISATYQVIRTRRRARATIDPPSNNAPTLRGLPDSELYIFDTPLLDDADSDDAHILIYMTITGAGQPNWPGGYIATASDGAVYSALTNVQSDASRGQVMNVVPDSGGWGDGFKIIFRGYGNPLETRNTDEETVISDPLRNLAFYGRNGRWEIVQWTTSFSDGRGAVTVSGVRRGLRGTSSFGHQMGDLFIPVNANLRSVSFPLDIIGKTQYFKAVGYGQVLNHVPTYRYLVDGASLRPWAPNIARIASLDTGSGDIAFTWYRRDRKGFSTWGNALVLPQSDPPETYELEIVGEDGDVIRTETGIVSPSWVYDSADQSTDGYVASTNIHIRVYQVSPIVGRGVPGEAIVRIGEDW